MNSLKKFFSKSVDGEPLHQLRKALTPKPTEPPEPKNKTTEINDLRVEILNALREVIEIPQHVTNLTITIDTEELSTVTVTYYPRKKSTEDSHEQRPESNIGQDPGNH